MPVSLFTKGQKSLYPPRGGAGVGGMQPELSSCRPPPALEEPTPCSEILSRAFQGHLKPSSGADPLLIALHPWGSSLLGA